MGDDNYTHTFPHEGDFCVHSISKTDLLTSYAIFFFLLINTTATLQTRKKNRASWPYCFSDISRKQLYESIIINNKNACRIYFVNLWRWQICFRTTEYITAYHKGRKTKATRCQPSKPETWQFQSHPFPQTEVHQDPSQSSIWQRSTSAERSSLASAF